MRVQVYDSYLSCKPSHKKLDSNTQTAAFKAERGHAALFFFDFSDFCSAQIVFFQENWVKSLPTWELNLLESS